MSVGVWSNDAGAFIAFEPDEWLAEIERYLLITEDREDPVDLEVLPVCIAHPRCPADAYFHGHPSTTRGCRGDDRT